MVIETTNCLLEAIAELGLVEADRIAGLSGLAEGQPNLRDLGRQLIRHELLTAYQVNQLLQGRGKQLLIGPYVLLQRIGVGGMGEVFKARHRRLQRIAAVKVVSRERLNHVNARQRFRREAEAAARLSHPNIVAVYDFGEEADVHYLAMELIDGIDLSRLVGQTGPLPIALACDFIRQAAVGLHHAHEQGFVHRDIKPQNLLVAPRGANRVEQAGVDPPNPIVAAQRYIGGTVKILDMGLIRLAPVSGAQPELALTQNGVVIGTMDYLSPEQALNSHLVDHRADVYSLGCTLYHLLAGQPPFPGGLPLDKLLRHQTEQPRSLGKVRRDIPPDVDKIVLRMLAKRPEDRPPTAADVAIALAPFAGRSPATAVVRKVQPAPAASVNEFAALAPSRAVCDQPDPSLVVTPPPRRAQTRTMRAVGKRRPGRWLAGGVAVLGVLIAGIMFLSKPAASNSAAKKTPAPVDRLADYLPPDTCAVVQVHPKAWLTAAILRPGTALPKRLFEPDVWGNPSVLGVDPRQVDWVRFHFSAADSTWLAHGPFDPARFSGAISVDRGVEGKLDLFRYRPPKGKGLILGQRDSYLIAGQQPERIRAALEHARTGKSPPAPATLRHIVQRIDHKQQAWLAVLCKPLGPVSRPTNEPFADAAIQKVLKNARLIEGGLSCGADLEVRLRVEANDEAAARRIVEVIHGVQSGYGIGLAFTSKKEYDKRLWMMLVHKGQLTRDALWIDFTSRVTPAMMK
jgi:serine/threonine protein kinase